jgi:hypothetical protein
MLICDIIVSCQLLCLVYKPDCMYLTCYLVCRCDIWMGRLGESRGRGFPWQALGFAYNVLSPGMEMFCGNLPQSNRSLLQRAGAGSIYTSQFTTQLSGHQHKRYTISACNNSPNANSLAARLATSIKMLASNTLASVTSISRHQSVTATLTSEDTFAGQMIRNSVFITYQQCSWLCQRSSLSRLQPPGGRKEDHRAAVWEHAALASSRQRRLETNGPF